MLDFGGASFSQPLTPQNVQKVALGQLPLLGQNAHFQGANSLSFRECKLNKNIA